MRVFQLATEFNISSKELLDKLRELKIPAKSHASVLSEENVKLVRENLAPEIKQRAGKLDEAEAKQFANEQAKKKEREEKEAKQRREAVKKERALREAERQKRTAAPEKDDSESDNKPEGVFIPTHVESELQSLADQIENEKARVKRENAERRAREKAAKLAADIQKKQNVENALKQRAQKTTAKKEPVQPSKPKQKKNLISATHKKGSYDSLLSQIEAEKKRIDSTKEKPVQKDRPKRNRQRKQNQRRDNALPPTSATPSAPVVIEEQAKTVEADSKDRYAQMAVQVEKMQRDKILAEARAAVAAANSVEGEGRRKKRKEKRQAQERERMELEAIEKGLDPDLVLDSSVSEVVQGSTVAEFAEVLGVASNDIIKRLFMLGQVLTLTQSMSDELIELIADDLGRKVRIVSPEEEFAISFNDSESDLLPRCPVVTVMGHVDHGKTSLLDAIRHSGVALGEAGGITQHIGASVVDINDRTITFIDTPGHEAFTAMRARGAQVTDVIVLVVAADDGVMPQTKEAINHARAANVPIVVAVNKIDKPGANLERVRQELTTYGVTPEEWGGDVMFVDVSAKKNLNIDTLLETILLQSDVLELKANPHALASGFVIESNLDKGRGPVATVLVQRGTLKPGDSLVAGCAYGRVRALLDPHGKHVQSVVPGQPAEVLGLNSVPTAGDEFRVFEDERDARKLAEQRALRVRLAEQEKKSHMNLDSLFEHIEAGKQTDLNLIVKADVQGSIEALADAFKKMDQSEVRINIVHSAVGGITETDVTLATASDAIIIGFNVRPTGKSRQLAEKERVDIRLYRIIYEAIEEINAARVGLLSPDIVEEDTGIAEVRNTFKVPKVGMIAGCYIREGEIGRDDKVRIVRDGTVIYEGRIASLRRFKDDVKSVKTGYECGIGVSGYQDIKEGDTIEGYIIKEIERSE